VLKKLTISLLSVALTTIVQMPSEAGVVWDRIKETGVIQAGTRTDSIPFAYRNQDGEWVGYSLDVLELIRAETEKQLGKPIKLELVEVTPENRFQKIEDQSIDLECGSTTFTWERAKIVDFSLSYFVSGTRLLVKKGNESNLGTISALANQRIGVIAETTNESVIKNLQPQAQFITVQDRFEGLKKLENGEIDGFASDGIILEGLRRTANNPDDLAIVPDAPYLLESYACILPQDDSQWRYLVNYSLFRFMQGMVTDNLNSVAIYERWFGENGVNPYPREQINGYFEGIMDSLEWLPFNSD
jgi:polar amino acid transport system substrate-binding protein